MMAAAMVEEAIKRYVAEGGRGFTQRDADELGPEIERYQGLTNAEVVDEVRNKPQSAIHKHLTWHDFSAAEIYRRLEVGMIRRSIRVVTVTNGEEQEAQASYLVPVTLIDPTDQRVDARHQTVNVGISLEELLDNDGAKEVTLQRVVRSLIQFKRKYGQMRRIFGERYPVLENLFANIDELEAVIQDES